MKTKKEIIALLHEATLSPADFKRYLIASRVYLTTFLKWCAIAIVTGIIGGLIGTLFHKSVEGATELFQSVSWLLYLLPVGGLVIVFLYHVTNMEKDKGTNRVIASVRSDGYVSPRLAPLIFVSTFITHLLGGSAGREGAALQLGGSIGSMVGRVLRLKEEDQHLTVMCGMSALFSALFGTPLTASVFAMEVISVGIFHYSGLIPCIVASLVAYGISLIFGLEPVHFVLSFIPALDVVTVVKVVVLAMLCALVNIIFCICIKGSEHIMKNHIKNDYIRAFVGGAVIIALTFIVGSRDYNGAGMSVIEDAIYNGHAAGGAFILKILFTSVTIAAGFKGGEIVPMFFVGSTFGCMMGHLLGLDPGFAAAVGLAATFCGIVNCPIASIILSVELFGSQGLLLFAIACAVSYMLSGYYSLYTSQKIIYSKLRTHYVNKNAR